MSTKTKTTDSATFDPQSQGAYQSLQNPLMQGLQQNMSDPWSAMAFNTQLAQGNRQVFGQGQQYQQGTAQSMLRRGINPSSPLFAAQLGRSSMAASRGQNAMYGNLLLTAGNLQQGSAEAAMQYQPLQTGQTKITKTGGLGAWLPS